jgi:hypothetical protein
MNEPGCPSRALFFVPGWRASIQGLCARLSCANAARNASPRAKVAPAPLAEPFFVPIVPLAGEFVPNARGDSTRAAPAPCGITDVPGLKCRARNPEISRQTAPNCPQLGRSIAPRWPVGTGFAKLMQTIMRHNCRRFEDMHDLEPSPHRPYYDQSMPPFPRLKRRLSRPVKYP